MSGQKLVAERLRRALDSGKHYDQTFLLKNGERILGHKLIFAISSPMFDSMLFGKMPVENEILINDVDPQAFKVMVRFFYTDELEIETVGYAKSIYEAANKYNIQHLRNKIEEYICTNLKAENALEFYEFANFYNISCIKKICLQLVQDETESIINSSTFYQCSQNSIQLFVDQDRLNISELELFNCIENWAQNKAENNGVTLPSLVPSLFGIIKKIRFLTMSASDFISTPYRSELLSAEEKHNILVNIGELGSEPLINGLCDIARLRSAVCCHYHNVLVNHSLTSLWALYRLDEGCSFNPYLLQVNQRDNEEEPSYQSLMPVSRKIILQFMLSEGFRPSSRIIFSGVVLIIQDLKRFRIDFLCKGQYNVNRANGLQRRRTSLHEDDIDIAFHMYVKFDSDCTNRNTKVKGSWRKDEEEYGPLVFTRGSTFVLEIECQEEYYKVSLNGSLYCNYRPRMQPNLITHVAVGGCVDIHSVVYHPPYMVNLHNRRRQLNTSNIEGLESISRVKILESLLSDGFRPSSRITFTVAILHAPQGFSIDFLCDSIQSVNTNGGGSVRRLPVQDDDVDIAFQFNTRFDEQNIIRNTKINKTWSDNVEREGEFVFSRKKVYVIEISCYEEAFKVTVNGSLYCLYNHRIEPHLITHVAVGGCVDIHSAVYFSHKGVWQQIVKQNP